MQEGQIVGGKYRLLRTLAKGGMGSVWVGEHVNLGMPIAVKFMEPALAAMDDLRGRFEREAKAVARLRTPNVVQIHDYGLEGDTPYIVMELLQGQDLGARLASAGRLPLIEALPILVQLGKTLRHAHEQGIVHRDLKPANVFLAQNNDEVLVKVLDFGIAKVRDSGLVNDAATKTGTVMGSPHYMSPEQVRGLKELDHRSDLWSLGVIIYRILTGKLPFPGSQLGDIFLRICTERPLAPSQICPEIDPRVDQIIEQALAVDPADRFQSANEMVTALNALSAPAAIESTSVPGSTGIVTGADITADVTTHRYQRPVRPPHEAVEGVSGGAPVVDERPGPAVSPDVVETATDAPVTHPWNSGNDDVSSGDTAAVGARGHRTRLRKMAAIGSVAGLLVVCAIIYARTRGTPAEARPDVTATAAPAELAPAHPVTPSRASQEPEVRPGSVPGTTTTVSGGPSGSGSAAAPLTNGTPKPSSKPPATVRSTAPAFTPAPTSGPSTPTIATDSDKSKRFGF